VGEESNGRVPADYLPTDAVYDPTPYDAELDAGDDTLLEAV